MYKVLLFISSLLFSFLLLGYTLVRVTYAQQTVAREPSFGFNARDLASEPTENIQNILGYLAKCQTKRINTLRIWADSARGQEADKIKEVLTNAPDSMKFVITLSDFYSSAQGDETHWYQDAINPNSDFYKHVDAITKEIASNPSLSSKVSTWEIMNEPGCTADRGCADAAYNFFKTTSELINKNDPNHLIGTGTQGQNTGTDNFGNGDYQRIINIPTITASSCHFYPKDSNSYNNCLEALKITKDAGKYFYIGEAGVEGPGNNSCSSPSGTNACSDQDLQERASEVFQYNDQFRAAGADGFLVWQFNPPQSPISEPDGASIYPGDPICGALGDLLYKPVPVPDRRRPLRQSSTKPYSSFAEESEAGCPNVEGASSLEPGDAGTYHKSGGGSEPALRGDLGLNFNTSVKGTHCGQTKSQPVVLQEIAPFDIFEGPKCKTVRWAGEIQMSYDNSNNFLLPFAKELADHWAGKGPEHDIAAGGFFQNIQQVVQKIVPGVAAPPPAPAGRKYPFIGVTNVDKNAENSPENNMWLRPAPVLVNQPKALIQCGYPADQPPDPQAPQLSSIVGTDPSKPDAFVNTYRVLDPGGTPAGNWDVGMLGLKSTAGQVVNTPGGGHDIDGEGHKWMVTYADEHHITLINATQDTVVIDGQLPYVIHIEVDVLPNLLQDYRDANSAGRNYLPALSGSEPIGVASGGEVRVAVRDSGDWMDPRSKGDWWQDHPDAPIGGLCKGGAGTPRAKKNAQDRKLLTDAGVLKKLLSVDNQDQLKCSFINYVKKKGPISGYANFSFDGTRLTDIPCPPSVSGNHDQKANNDWRNSWGKTWAKMGLFPDEKSTGQLRFAVCADRLYDLEMGYPSVFRLGMAANQLFKLFTAKDKQDTYYRASNDETNLKRPLDQNRSLVKTLNEGSSALAGIFQNLFDNVKQTFSSLASEIGKWIAFAQETVSPTVTPNVFVKDGKIQFYATVTNPSFVEDDMAVEVTINGEKKGTSGYHNVRNPAIGVGGSATFGSIGSGATFEVWDPLPLTPGQTYDISYDISTAYQCLNNKLCGEGSNFTGSGQNMGYCGVKVTSGGNLDKNCGGQPPPPPPVAQACAPNTCCETGSCSASCAICGRAQKDPSDTTIWPASYPHHHVLLGVNWSAQGQPILNDDTKVKLTWKIPEWKEEDPLPDGCQLIDCAPTNLECRLSHPYVCSQGKCGWAYCAKVHSRVVDIFNNAPFLASVWNQAAGAGSGFFNIFRSASLKGSGLNNNITGCTTNTDLVLGPSGNFGSNPAYSQITYNFDQCYGGAGACPIGGNEVTVTQTSPGSRDKAKVTWYRLGGVCNADKWVSEKLVAPR